LALPLRALKIGGMADSGANAFNAPGAIDCPRWAAKVFAIAGFDSSGMSTIKQMP